MSKPKYDSETKEKIDTIMNKYVNEYKETLLESELLGDEK